MLSVENLHVSYGKVPAIKGLSLKIEKEQIVTLLGANGTGKTTTALSLGQALALEGKKTLVVDNDSQCNASNVLLGDDLHYSLFEVLKYDKDVSIDNCIYK